jgi:hypothetical protein
VLFYVATQKTDLLKLRNIFDLRHIFLRDVSGTLYNLFRVPDPEAPYPQDCIIGKGGKIRGWEVEYDPQKAIQLIEKLLEE